MTMFQLLTIPQFPQYTVFASFFINVKNTDFIKGQLIKGNTDYDFAFINADNILSMEQLYSALYRSLVDKHNDRMKSKTLHTEVIFNLAPQKNIMECLNKFGISTNSTSLIVLKIVKTGDDDSFDDIFEKLNNSIEGDALKFNDDHLKSHGKLHVIKKNFKLGDAYTDDLIKLNRLLIGVTQLKGL